MAIKGTRILKAPQLKVKRKKVGSSTQRVSKDALGRTRISRFMKADGDGKVRQQTISIVRPKRPPTKAVPKNLLKRPGDRKKFKGGPAPRRKPGEKAPPMIGRPAPRRKFGQKNKMIPARKKR
jgi:hypothetical protein|tara:strand:- start:4 stop:372 length:369 start_codon:yes stop_codon:yes gene_type:complete